MECMLTCLPKEHLYVSLYIIVCQVDLIEYSLVLYLQFSSNLNKTLFSPSSITGIKSWKDCADTMLTTVTAWHHSNRTCTCFTGSHAHLLYGINISLEWGPRYKPPGVSCVTLFIVHIYIMITIEYFVCVPQYIGLLVLLLRLISDHVLA